MDVHDKFAELIAYVEAARSVPMSSSAVVNRSELLTMLTELQEQLPHALSSADHLLADSDRVIAEAREEAEVIVEEGRIRQAALIKTEAVVMAAEAEAERVRAAATDEAETIKREADDYADARLANFEVVLARLLEAVRGGREHLAHAAFLPDLTADGDAETISAEARVSEPAPRPPSQGQAPAEPTDEATPTLAGDRTSARSETPSARSAASVAAEPARTTGWTPQSV